MYGLIYLSTNTINGKQYVGQTTRTTEQRWKQHCQDAKYVREKQRHCPIELAIRKYGQEAFTVKTVQECRNQKELDTAELEWCRRLNTFAPNGYNLRAGNGKGSLSDEAKYILHLRQLGKTHSIAARRKMSITRTGKRMTEYHRQRMAPVWESMKGRPKSYAHRLAVAQRAAERKGVPLSIEHRRAISQGMMGRPVSDAHRTKMSQTMRQLRNSPEGRLRYKKAIESMKGRKLSEATRQKIREKHIGKRISDETRLRMSLAHLANGSRPWHFTSAPRGPHSEETRRRMGLAQRGKKISQEQRRRISQTLLARNRGWQPLREHNAEEEPFQWEV